MRHLWFRILMAIILTCTICSILVVWYLVMSFKFGCAGRNSYQPIHYQCWIAK